ncbi:acetate/propionate family kinase [soil metagenome]
MADQHEIIAIFNAGSSSLKFSIYDGETALYQGLIDRLGTAGSGACRSVIKGADRIPIFDGQILAKNHEEALDWLLGWLDQQPNKVRPAAIGHRVVHGGDEFTAPARITDEVLAKLKKLTPLAPLHQPHCLAPILYFKQRLPDLLQVACFDTAFHATQSRIERMYALPEDYFARGIKRYGFHGLSYEFIAGRLAALDSRAAQRRTIVCHLGNGASLCALSAGRSVATTMGFTPLDGIPMGTRSGSISADVVLHLQRQDNMSVEQMSDLLYHRSGLLGISGISADMRDLLASPEASAAEAVEYFCYRTAREIGSLVATLGGLDALVFTAGIGEHAPKIRARIVEWTRLLGLIIDAEANQANRSAIHAPASAVQILVIPTDEELMICRHTRHLRNNVAR